MLRESRQLRGLARLGQARGGVLRALDAVHLTVAGAVLLVFAIGGWLLAHHLGSRTMYLLVYAGVLVIGAAWLAARRRLAMTIERSALPGRVREGQTINVELELSARRRATTLIMQERLDPVLGDTVRFPVLSISPGQTVDHSYSFTPQRRGVYQLGPLSATWSDPFGLTTQAQQLADPVTLIVHPRTEPAFDRVLTRMWEDPPVRPPVSKPWPTGFEFYGMRDYVPGDDLRRVVWSAVAKTGKLLVRESEQGITDRVCIFLDTHRGWHSPGVPSETFETGVRVAASLCSRHITDGFAVSLHSNDLELSAGLRGSRARYQLLDHLARIQLSTTALSKSGARLLSEARRGAHFAVITPHLDRAVADQLRIAIERGVSVALVKLVWEESDPLSWAHAAELGCQVIQVSAGGSIEAAFGHGVQRVGGRR